MNPDLKLLNDVLDLNVGQVYRVAARKIGPSMWLRAHSIHRYDDGWTVLLDKVPAILRVDVYASAALMVRS